MSDEIDSDIRTFIAENIGSVAQLELVLLLHAKPDQRFVAGDVAKMFALAPEITDGLLASLCRQGFAAATADPTPAYYYAPHSVEIDRRVADLAELYRQRRVSLIQLIYSQPVDKLRIFADAFRFRKGKEGN
jgi:hypothetical protein